jgi:acetoin utilization deacetylase AcuC-like enzyme
MVFHSDGTAHIFDGNHSYIGLASSDGNILTFSGHREGNDWFAGASYEYSKSDSELTITTVISENISVMNGTYNS